MNEIKLKTDGSNFLCGSRLCTVFFCAIMSLKSTLFCDGQQYEIYYMIGFMIHIICTITTIGAFIHCICFMLTKNKPDDIKAIFAWLIALCCLVCVMQSISAVVSYTACYTDLISLSYTMRM